MNTKSYVPLLKQENIQELNQMVLSIMEENNAKLQKIFENYAINQKNDLAQFPIQTMHKVLDNQFHKKQKIIDNLCHFSLSLMNTVDVLWQQKQDLQIKIEDINNQIQKLSQHLYEKDHENQLYKNRLQQADLCIDQLIQDKQRLEGVIRQESKFQQELKMFQLLKAQNQNFNPQKNELKQKEIQTQNQNQNYQQQLHQLSHNRNKKVIQQGLEVFSNDQKQNQHQESRQSHENYSHQMLQESIIKQSIERVKNSNLFMQQNLILWNQQKQARQQKSSQTKGETQENSQEDQGKQKQKQKQKQKDNAKDNDQIVFKDIRQQKQDNNIQVKLVEKVDIGVGVGGQLNEFFQQDEMNNSIYASCIQQPQKQFQIAQSQSVYSRQNSAIWTTTSKSGLKPILQKTKSLQVCLFQKQPIFKPVMKKNVQKKSIAIQASPKLIKKQSLNTAQTQNDRSVLSFLNKSLSMNQLKKGEQKTLTKNEDGGSMSKLFGYFTNKVVKSRIKINKKGGNQTNQLDSSRLQKSSILSMNESRVSFKKMVK